MSETATSVQARVLARISLMLDIDAEDPFALVAAMTSLAGVGVSIGDCERLNAQIGLPSSLMRSIKSFSLQPESALRDDLSALLVRSLSLYAMAMETLGDETLASEWWRTPIALAPEGVKLSPKEWSAEACASQLVARMRKTLMGTF